jgi:hypothetical protein
VVKCEGGVITTVGSTELAGGSSFHANCVISEHLRVTMLVGGVVVNCERAVVSVPVAETTIGLGALAKVQATIQLAY